MVETTSTPSEMTISDYDISSEAKRNARGYFVMDIVRHNVHKIEAMVRDGLERGFDNAKFVYKQSANNIFDITELVLGEIDHYTSNVIDKVYGAFKNIAEIDTLLVTGGTSNILNHDMFEKAFAKQAAVVFVDNAEYANVNGFLKYDKYLNSNM